MGSRIEAQTYPATHPGRVCVYEGGEEGEEEDEDVGTKEEGDQNSSGMCEERLGRPSAAGSARRGKGHTRLATPWSCRRRQEVGRLSREGKREGRGRG